MPRSNRVAQRTLLLSLLSLIAYAAGLSGCDRRTAQEKGRDFANEKVGFAEGAAGVLEEKGKGIGSSVGKGVGELVKGAGVAAKDVVYPPVKVTLAPELSTAEVKILQAHEGEDDASARKIVAELEFVTAFVGRLELRALDSQNQELARSQLTGNLTPVAGDHQRVEFAFARDARLSKIDHCVLYKVAPKTVTVAKDLESAELTLSQLNEEPNRVSVYVVFNKAYRGALQLRASNASGQEIGRSEPTERLSQTTDSAAHLSFDFDPRTKLAEATSYVVHKTEPKRK